MVEVRQPLQPVDERNFVAGKLGRDKPFSFDAAAYRAALAGRDERRPRAPFLAAVLDLPDDEPGEIDLDDLVRALEHPAKWFLRRRLGLTLADDDPDVDDRLPLALGPLAQWAVGDRMLAACLDGVPREQAFTAERLRGELPPGQLARSVLTQVDSFVVPVAQAARATRVGAAAAVDIAVPLGDGRRLTGTVQGVFGDVLVRAEYSKLAPKHRLRAWVQLLALTAGTEQPGWRAVTIGRLDARFPGVNVATLQTPPARGARDWLEQLVAVRDRALREPLPLPVAPACDYAGRRRGAAPEQQAFDEAVRRWRRDHLHEDVYHVRCWGEETSLRQIAGTPRGDEQNWWPEELTRFGVLSRQVWDPLLHHERLQARRAAS
jgi:exodeoxyribonuclease V gamma subunit